MYQLDFYSDTDIEAIVARSAQVLDMPISHEVVKRIASRSRATPRVANALLKRVRDFAQVHEKQITAEVCDEACRLFGIDELGLTKDDRRYLSTLRDSFKGGPCRHSCPGERAP